MNAIPWTRFLLIAAICVAATVNCVQPVSAQYFGVFDAFSPLAWFPGVEGDVKARLVQVHIGSGSVSGPEGGSLAGTFHLNKDVWFIDSAVRFQLSRLSVRVAYEPREFSGFRPGFQTEARFSYSGLRLGGDLDFIQCNRTRFGVDVDYDFFTPKFTYPTNILPFPRVASGANALTMGLHATYNPLKTIFGVSGIIDARVRWPMTGTEVTDWEIDAGLASPSTLLGSWAVKAGYRGTRLSFVDADVQDIRFENILQGWFTEFAFYY
ncbi:MAG TPA: hypothetical protein VK463_15585 [Desulfomonilaceae bacterium]|nr:hypothetical protein [Desulfomonilaceae bacterium]